MTFDDWCATDGAYLNDNDLAARAARLMARRAWDAAAAAERGRCAKIADEHARRNYPWGSENTDLYHAQADWAKRIAAVIRRA